jgi:S1-C subfamily serine protease
MDSPLSALSTALAALAAEASRRLFHVPSSTGGRSALSFDGKRLIVPAVEAEKGETVEVFAPGGAKVSTKVIGFDSGAGFAVLELPSALPDSAWKSETAMPALGSVVLAVAYPSDEGPEARLDVVRIAKGEPGGEDAYIQVAGAAFPGFSGGALVSPSGKLAGIIAVDGNSNRGWALPAAKAAALVDLIVAKGFPSQAWLGVSTVSIDPPEAWKGRGIARRAPGNPRQLRAGQGSRPRDDPRRAKEGDRSHAGRTEKRGGRA